MSTSIDNPLVMGIDLPSVSAYLASAGWTRRASFPRSDVLVFDGPPDDSGQPITAVIPRDEGDPGYRARLAELVRTLSIIEGRDHQEIALDMRSPGADRLLARVASSALPLPFASALLGSLRELIVAAACAEEDPRPFFAKATKSGTDHALSWRMAQTQVGSFVVPIECAVAPAVGQQPLPNAPPLSRRVATRIMRGLGALEQAVLDGQANALIDSYKAGLNANMCEALLALRPTGTEIEIEISAHWSNRVPAPDGVPRGVRLEAQGFELLRATAGALRTPKGAVEREFQGTVVRLFREGDDGVAVLQFDESGRKMLAQVRLCRADYAVACDAHRDQLPVRVHGRLEPQSAKKWRILAARGFSLDEALTTPATLETAQRAPSRTK